MDQTPLVSILVPAYNVSNYLPQAIFSITNQTYKNIEIIIVDDGSKDNTFETALSLSKKDSRIKVIRQANAGASAARNNAFKHCQGQFIKFFDADDVLTPQSIAAQVALAQTNPECIISGCWGRFYHDDLKNFSLSPETVWRDMSGIDWILESWTPPPNMTQPGIFLIPRTLIESTGLWDEELTLLDDMPFFTRLILTTKKVVFCSESTLCYRSGIQSSLSKQHSFDAMQSALKAIDRSVEYLLSIQKNEVSLQACANQYFLLLYQIYPSITELIEPIEERIRRLNVSPNIIQGTPVQKILSPLLGWKLAKRIHHFIRS